MANKNEINIITVRRKPIQAMQFKEGMSLGEVERFIDYDIQYKLKNGKVLWFTFEDNKHGFQYVIPSDWVVRLEEGEYLRYNNTQFKNNFHRVYK